MLEDIQITVNEDDIALLKEKLILMKKEFTILENIIPKAKNKVGGLFKATLRGEEVICKHIILERVNNFIVEGFLEILFRIR